LSRAFVKEDDEDLSSFRDDENHAKKTIEWLRIQEKKLDFFLNDPKGMAIESSKRGRWIKEAKDAIKAAKDELGL
jgi:epoxyqueuosine reductase QueG